MYQQFKNKNNNIIPLSIHFILFIVSTKVYSNTYFIQIILKC